ARDPHVDRTKDLESRFGVATTSENLKAARSADIVIMSVKPQRNCGGRRKTPITRASTLPMQTVRKRLPVAPPWVLPPRLSPR
ncbi:MAG: NAD(P)-binding domain-containing protein, partial [Sphingorhabdus sp.]|nr:NAD(P)-binding domain-containing protein [Sphingorhabdus sp.]